MKTIKKTLCILLAVILCVNLSISALGYTGLVPDADGVVTYSGIETIPDYDQYLGGDKDSVKKLFIEEGIKTIGAFAFSKCENLTEVHLPASLQTVGQDAFSDCTALTTVYYAGTEAERSAITFNKNNDILTSANWIYAGEEGGGEGDNDEPGSDTEPVTPVKLALRFSSATVIEGETATVELRLTDTCSRLGAQLVVSAADASGKSLGINKIELATGGSVNEGNNGTLVIASNGALAAGSLLATISFDTETAGTYTLSLSGEMYTGADNTPVEYSLSGGSITVKEPTVTVSWNNHDGVLIYSESVDVGTVPSYSGSNPVKASDRLYDYSFSGWDKTPAAVSEDTVYTARFSSSPRSYSVSIDCGISGAAYTVTNSSGQTVTPASDGSFALLSTETYSASVDAVGCVETVFTIAISDESADWSFDGSSAVLSINAPAAHIGDVDDDGDVDMQDAQHLFDYLAGNITLGDDGIARSGSTIIFNSNVADINANGGVGADDILPMLDLTANA